MSHNDDGLSRRLRLLLLSSVLLLFHDILAVPGQLSEWVEEARRRPNVALRNVKQWLSNSITYLPNVLLIYWIYTLSWGEIDAFTKSIERCDWSQWEHWVSIPYSPAAL